MAKTSSVEKNNRRRKLVGAVRRQAQGAEGDHHEPVAADRGAFPRAAEAGRDAAQLGAKIRIRNRCEVTGRPRAYYRKLKMSRIALRELGNSRARSPASSSRAGKEDTNMSLS